MNSQMRNQQQLLWNGDRGERTTVRGTLVGRRPRASRAARLSAVNRQSNEVEKAVIIHIVAQASMGQ